MDPLIEKYWSESLLLMKTQFTELIYNTWMKNLTPLYIKDGFFYLQAPNKLYKDTINSRYIKTVTDSVKAITEKEDLEIKIILEEDLDSNLDENKSEANINKKINSYKNNSNLVSKYVFENFVKGKSNDLAYATAVAVADSPGTTMYNPLFLYGGVGLGKTHLMHSIGNYIISQNPKTRVLYCSTETFMNELINSIRQNKNQEFRDKYRDIDVLLIDDIQFLSDKEGTQEEFFHTFNTLYNANKQIVISSDLPPKEIKTLEERLSSRFGWGIIVDIQLPDFETRTAILEKKAELDNIHIPKEITKFIAQNVVSNIRDLEGALNKVAAYAKLSNTEITQSLAEYALQDLIIKNEKKEISVDYVQKVVADNYDITVEDIIGKKRTQNISYPRQVAMYLCRKLIDISLPKIGKAFGNRDHSTIIHGCDKISELIESNETIRNELLDLEKRIKEN